MALVAVHHDRKAQSPDFVDDVSGTNGLAGSADTIVVLRRDRNQPDGVLLVTGRDVTEAAYAVTFDGGAWTLHGDSWEAAASAAAEVAATVGRGELAGRIVAWLATNAAGTPTEIATDARRDRQRRQAVAVPHVRRRRRRPRQRHVLPARTGDAMTIDPPTIKETA